MVVSRAKPRIWAPGRNPAASDLWRGCVAYWPMWEMAGRAGDYADRQHGLTLTGTGSEAAVWTTGDRGAGIALTRTSSTGSDLNTDATQPVPLLAGQDFTFFACARHTSLTSSMKNWGWWRKGAYGTGDSFCIHQKDTHRPWVRWNGTDVLKPASGAGITVGLRSEAYVIRSGLWCGWYLDGVLAQDNTHAKSTPSGTIEHFTWQSTVNEGVSGTVYAMGIWNRALSAGEIKTLAADPFVMIRRSRPPAWAFSDLAAGLDMAIAMHHYSMMEN